MQTLQIINAELRDQQQVYLCNWEAVYQSGETVGIYGPIGSSTMYYLLIASGYLPPTAGDVKWLRDGAPQQLTKSDVGWVNMDALLPLQPYLTIQAYIETHAKLYRQMERDSEVESLIADWELSEYRKQRITDITPLLKLKTHIVAALCQRPQMLLLHTPAIGLIEEEWAAVWSQLMEAQKQQEWLLLMTTTSKQQQAQVTHWVDVVAGGEPDVQTVANHEG